MKRLLVRILRALTDEPEFRSEAIVVVRAARFVYEETLRVHGPLPASSWGDEVRSLGRALDAYDKCFEKYE